MLQVVDLTSECQEALINYRLKYVLPSLSIINQQFVSSISIEDIIKLRKIRSQYYAFTNNLSKNENNLETSFSKYLGPENKEDLLALLTKFKIKTEDTKGDFEKLRTKWSNDQDEIVVGILDSQNLSSKQKLMLSKGQFKIKEELFDLHILMIYPFDKGLYLQNLDLVFNQQKYFQQIIK